MFKAILTYDGTRYFGWQKTRAGPSIQEEIEKALLQITGERATPEAASRTDRGVHAEGQVIQFALKNPPPPHRLLKALNAVLPTDLRILEITPCEFHPTLDAIGKEYHYRLSLTPVQEPTDRLYAWHIPYSLDRQAIERAAQALLGTHDFSAFANQGEKGICTLSSIYLEQDRFYIRGTRFLYKMVRNLVGTLLYIGLGKILPSAMAEILASHDRKKSGLTAPAHGLYLHQVFYPLN